MLIAHRLIDVLLGRSDEVRLSEPSIDRDYRLLLAQDIKRAEKFEFVSVPLETRAGGAVMPEITADEAEAWQRGLIPLPAPCVWYECTVNGCREGYLIHNESDNKEWVYERIDWLPAERRGEGTVLISGVRIGLHRDTFNPRDTTARAHVIVYGDGEWYRGLSEERKNALFPITDGVFGAVYLTMMINSRTTEITGETAPERLNRARTRRNQSPLFDHRVVRIVPERFVTRGDGSGGGTHASPRIHWRRSHIRTLHRGTPNERQILIPRMLVGRADLGEVTHEYRIG